MTNLNYEIGEFRLADEQVQRIGGAALHLLNGPHASTGQPARLAAFARDVLALHVPVPDPIQGDQCSECAGYDYEGLMGCDWPCPTVELAREHGIGGAE